MLLRSYRHLRPGQDDNFSIFASDTIVSLWERLTATIAGMAVGIVSVFMVVGGIVIMNIMLAVVTERTHEIGIRKSLGARRRDILNQYLVESVGAGRRGRTGGRGGGLVRGGRWCAASPRCRWRCPGRRCSSAWDSRRRWACSSASIRRGRRPGSTPSKRCGWRDRSMTRLAFLNGLVLAFETIRSHKLRAFLTVLGVIIGTGTIIGVAAILTGFDASMTAVLRSFGPNSIIVFKFPVGPRTSQSHPRGAHPQGPHLPERRRHPRALQSGGRRLHHAVPQQQTINVHYKGNDMYDVNLFGVEEAYARGGQVDMHLGRFFTDEESRRKHAGGGDRRRISRRGCTPTWTRSARPSLVDGHEFQVIGTMLRPAASFFGDTDNRVLLPYGTMQKMYPNAHENAIVVTAEDGMLPRSAGRSAHGAAHRPARALQQARQFRALHRRADGRRTSARSPP